MPAGPTILWGIPSSRIVPSFVIPEVSPAVSASLRPSHPTSNVRCGAVNQQSALCQGRDAPSAVPPTVQGLFVVQRCPPVSSGAVPQQGDGSPFDAAQAELPGGGEGLAEPPAGTVDVSRSGADEEHVRPFEPGAGCPWNGAEAFVHVFGTDEAIVGRVELAQDGGQQTEIVRHGAEPGASGGGRLVLVGGEDCGQLVGPVGVGQVGTHGRQPDDGR